MEISGVIFDWAGTTVDFGSCAPVEVFLNIFEEAGVEVTHEEARKPMGMLKIEHIRTMLNMDRIESEWEHVHGHLPNEVDVEKLYKNFEIQLFATLRQFATPISGTLEAVAQLREQGIKIGSTTGYTREMIEIVQEEAKKLGYAPDCIMTAEDVGNKGRPYPFMIFENMKQLDISSVKEVIKVGDTVADIQEGNHAGVYSVGVIVGSSLMGLTEAEYAALSPEEQLDQIELTREKFIQAGADTTITTLKELPGLIQALSKA